MKLSIIVPIYNSEPYLNECLYSIAKSVQFAHYQDDIELILVDDGSKDNSGVIAEKFSNKNSFTKVIHMENHGVSYARNKGIENAVGDYIAFIDSDDLVSTDGIKIMIQSIQKYNSDIIFFSYYKQDDKKNSTIMGYSFSNCKKYCDDIRMPFYKDGGLAPWSKLIRREIIVNNNIKFNTFLKIHEDVIFLFDCFLKAHTIAYDSSSFYQYNYTIGGALRKADPSYLSNYEYVYSYFINYLHCFCPPELLKDEVNKLNNEYLHKLLILACRLKKALYKRSYIKKLFENNGLYKTLIKEKYTGINVIKKWLLKYHLYTVGALKIK